MKKVLVFTDYYSPKNNGVVQYINNLYKPLIDSGKIELSVFTFNNTNSKFFEIQNGVKIYRLKSTSILGETYNLPSLKDWNIIRRKLRIEKFDVVNTHTRFFISSLFGRLFASKNKIKHIHTEHGAMFVPHPNFIVKICARIYDEIVGRFVVSGADVVCPVSKIGGDFCKRLGAKKIKVIENGVLNNFEKLDLDKNIKLKNKLNICFVGRLVEAKGVQDLIRVCSRLDLDYNLFIIGDGNYMDNLKSLSKELNVNAFFLGFKDRDYVMSFLSNMDIFVNPSYAEGFPTSVLEAGVCECRVLATDVGGTNEILLNVDDGDLFEPKDLNGMYNKILLMKDKKTKGDLKKFILENFEWIKLSEKYWEILK